MAEEEAEAKRLQIKAAQGLTNADFGLPSSEDDEDDDQDDQDNVDTLERQVQQVFFVLHTLTVTKPKAHTTLRYDSRWCSFLASKHSYQMSEQNLKYLVGASDLQTMSTYDITMERSLH